MKKTSVVKMLAALLILFTIPSAVLAARTNGNVFVGADETIDGNFIAAGDQVIIDGVVNGDVIVAGGVVTVTGAVAGDIIAAGGQVRILGPVQGDLRLAGGDVQVGSVIGKNVTIFAGNTQLMRESVIGWSAIVFTGNLDAMGKIEKNLRAAVGALKISGTVGEHVWARVGEPDQFILQPQAWIGGDLRYTSPARAEVMSGATINGEVDYKGIEMKHASKAAGAIGAAFLAGFVAWKLLQLISLWILGFILIWAFPKYIGKVSKELQKEFWPAMGRGLVFSIVFPLCLFVVSLTLVGLPIVAIAGALYMIALFFAVIHISTYFGERILKKLSKKRWKGVSQKWSMVLGVFLFILVTSIPGIGWILKWVLVSTGLGALLLIWHDDAKKWS